MEIQIAFPGGARVDAHMGNLTVATDQDGSAPAPFGLFLASIGTCAGTYVLGFCQHRSLPTDGIRIIQRVRSNPATRMVERIELDIEVPPDFPEKYHEALIRAADQCAVKRHLEHPPAIEVRATVAV